MRALTKISEHRSTLFKKKSQVKINVITSCFCEKCGSEHVTHDGSVNFLEMLDAPGSVGMMMRQEDGIDSNKRKMSCS